MVPSCLSPGLPVPTKGELVIVWGNRTEEIISLSGFRSSPASS